ncbi:MAG: amino acid permease [Epsilonproteobacteria bacterium]|nr:MAG: amino acid permease [Campylobacterota bacterium]RLA67318.1 MAG: amino acid permease [Campylobacterota bacterium]
MKTKDLGLLELVSISLGGMIGGGIFAILGISVEMVGNLAPFAVALGGILALMAGYSYAKLAAYYCDEGATYSFFKKTFPRKTQAASIIGWIIIFGYISTLALYAFTFSSYFTSFLHFSFPYIKEIIAGLIIFLFSIINIISVKGMGRIEDFLVYIKVTLLVFISILLFKNGSVENLRPLVNTDFKIQTLFIVAAITFVSFEGFQLAIHAFEEAKNPKKSVPRAIYISICMAILIYIFLTVAALTCLPKELLILEKEYALAAGATKHIGVIGHLVVIAGALLATSSAISGTLFGASRLMAVISRDGYLPAFLSYRKRGHIPHNAIIFMATTAFLFITLGELESILQFGSITFILVSFIMAYSNFVIRKKTKSNSLVTVTSMVGLGSGAVLILYYVYQTDKTQLVIIFSVYFILGLGAMIFNMVRKKKQKLLN